MTSIILVLVGIMLAAVSALFVVFYGGDAFNAGNTKAAAATIVNMGENVRHASDLYRASEGMDASNVGQLVRQGYLSQAPDPKGLGQAGADWRVIQPANALAFNGYVITGIQEQVCSEINRQTAGRDVVVEAAGVDTGCVADDSGHYFFVNVGRADGLGQP